jgi:hypothetical protein
MTWTNYPTMVKGDSYKDSNGNYKVGTDDPELDLGETETLRNFLQFCHEKYPFYKNHHLILSGHGNATNKNDDSDSLYRVSDSNGGYLKVNEMSDAIQNFYSSSDKLETLGLLMCSQGAVEVAYQFRNTVKDIYFSPGIASTGTIARYWRDFLGNFDNIIDSGSGTPQSDLLLEQVAESTWEMENYPIKYKGDPRNKNQMILFTGISLVNMEMLKTEIDELANELANKFIDTGVFDVDTATILRQEINKNTYTIDLTGDDNTDIFATLPRYIYKNIDIGAVCVNLMDYLPHGDSLRNKAQDVYNRLSAEIKYSSCSPWNTYPNDEDGNGTKLRFKYGYSLGNTTNHPLGLAIYMGNYLNWYQDSPYSSDGGNLEFCTEDPSTPEVDTWRELLIEWRNCWNNNKYVALMPTSDSFNRWQTIKLNGDFDFDDPNTTIQLWTGWDTYVADIPRYFNTYDFPPNITLYIKVINGSRIGKSRIFDVVW